MLNMKPREGKHETLRRVLIIIQAVSRVFCFWIRIGIDSALSILRQRCVRKSVLNFHHKLWCVGVLCFGLVFGVVWSSHANLCYTNRSKPQAHH